MDPASQGNVNCQLARSLAAVSLVAEVRLVYLPDSKRLQQNKWPTTESSGTICFNTLFRIKLDVFLDDKSPWNRGVVRTERARRWMTRTGLNEESGGGRIVLLMSPTLELMTDVTSATKWTFSRACFRFSEVNFNACKQTRPMRAVFTWIRVCHLVWTSFILVNCSRRMCWVMGRCVFPPSAASDGSS